MSTIQTSETTHEETVIFSSGKVCMYILSRARTGVRIMRAATALVEAGFEVTVIDVESEQGRPAEEVINGIHMRHILIPSWLTSRRFQPWFFLNAVRAFLLGLHLLMRSKADIYHAHELTSLPASFLVSRLRHKPLIYEAYELHFPLPETSIPFWRLLGGVLMRLLVWILPHCAAVIAASPYYAQEMGTRYRLAEVVTIRNVPFYCVVPKTNRLHARLGLSPNTRIALYQGVLQRNRRIDRLVRAAKFLEPNNLLVLMGEFRGTTQTEIETLIVTEGVGERLKVLPAVPYEELLEWTSSADVGLLVLPGDYSLSIRLTLPNKLFEYMMAGLPVLSSQLDAVIDVINTYEIGQIVTSQEPEAIGAAINAMLADQAALSRMGQNAKEAALHDFFWEKERQRLVDLYHTCFKYGNTSIK